MNYWPATPQAHACAARNHIASEFVRETERAKRDRRRRRVDAMLQTLIAVMGLAGIWLLGLPDGDPARRWGLVVMVCSQPLWIAVSIRSRQWGVLINAIFWSGALSAGVYRHFFS